MGIEDFNDAVDAFFCLAVLIGASRSEMSRLREQLQQTQVLRIRYRPSVNVQQPSHAAVNIVKQPVIKSDARYNNGSVKQQRPLTKPALPYNDIVKPGFRHSDSVKQPAFKADCSYRDRVPDIRDAAYYRSRDPVIRPGQKAEQTDGGLGSILCSVCEVVLTVLAGLVFAIGVVVWYALVFVWHSIVFLGTGLVVVGQSFFFLLGIVSYIALGLLIVALAALLVYGAIQGVEFIAATGSSVIQGVEHTIHEVNETIHHPWI